MMDLYEDQSKYDDDNLESHYKMRNPKITNDDLYKMFHDKEGNCTLSSDLGYFDPDTKEFVPKLSSGDIGKRVCPVSIKYVQGH